MKLLFILLTLTFGVVGCGSSTKNTKSTQTEKTINHAKMETTSHSKLDDLIRGEMAAVETYNQVIGKVTNKKEKKTLEAIRDDHQNAVTKLQKHANQPVLNDAKDSGAWGTFAKAWTGGAKVFGVKTAMKALIQGEEHGMDEYKELLEDEKVSQDLKETVKNHLIPKQNEHIKTLKSKI